MYYNYVSDPKNKSVVLPVRQWNWIFPAPFMLISLAFFLINTHKGIGIYPDTTRYMGINEQPYDAPLYAWLVQLPAAFGFDMASAAKVLGLFFVCANVLLICRLLVGAAGKPHHAAIGTALIVLAPQFVTQHSLAMSEPLFLLSLLVVLLTALRYLESGNRLWLVASAVALGLATLTRFTAPPMGAALATCFLLNARRSLARRIADAVLYGSVSGGIFFAWVAISYVSKGHSIGRELAFHGNMGAEKWLSSLGALTAWLLPDEIPFAARVLLLCAVAIAAGTLIYVQAARMLSDPLGANVARRFLPLMLGLFFLFYMAFMVLATSIEANLSLNGRYAFPPYVMTVMAVTIALTEFRHSTGLLKAFHHGLLALAIIVLSSHVARTTVRSLDAYRSGIGFASLEWTNSPTMRAVGELPATALIYSNGPDAIAYVLKRPAVFIPGRFELRTGIENPSDPFERQLSRLKDASEKQRTYIVMFDKVTWRFYRVTESELKQRLSLINVATEPDGRIYEVQPAAGRD
ncbi:glycosyltransferase family 39 protein [Ensifer aridi]|uniref:glycosyltransferase family 39 protein n=1 Tax=Ensifer aridi TaxID=1708715 RepID=UPI001556D26C|nr:glycosyltransferase family 39 protein [Ensifer aridi]